jgi:hypothetical protein
MTMDEVTFCNQCQRKFDNDDGQLHPTLDAIICPHCGAVNLFEPAVIHSWESYQEALLDEEWERHHRPDDD